jgi:hypothetical protein
MVPRFYANHRDFWSQFAKPDFGSHGLIGLCLIFATLIVYHILLFIWLTFYIVNYLLSFAKIWFLIFKHTL